jgi:hypothetical protein
MEWQKLINDTLKKNNGKWDKQAIAFILSFNLSVVLGLANTVLSYVLKITNNPTADNVFNSFMILTGALSGANIYNKITDSRIARQSSEIPENTSNTSKNAPAKEEQLE